MTRKLIFYVLILLVFQKSYSQIQCHIGNDDEYVIETSKITFVQILDRVKMMEHSEFSGFEPKAGAIIWEKPLSNIIQESFDSNKKDIRIRLFINWRYDKECNELHITSFRISGDYTNLLNKELITSKLLDVKFNFFGRDNLIDNQNLSFTTLFAIRDN